MPLPVPDVRLTPRDRAWKWWVCCLLLLATTVNYVDRVTFNQLKQPILHAFDLNNRNYGQIESVFGTAFALGAIIFGWLADRWGVRWLYPLAVLAWSAAGFATGLVGGFVGLLVCRFLLGLAESGNWPCALRTTQHILPPAERSFGNSILQSGAALGAVLTPPLVLLLLTVTGSWRPPFLLVGAVGTLWVVLWLLSVRPQDLATERPPGGPSLVGILGWLVALFALDLGVHLAYAGRERLPHELRTWADATDWLPLAVKALLTVAAVLVVFNWLRRATADDPGLPRHVFFRRFWVLATLVVTLNLTWHFFRAWLPGFLQEQHGYSMAEMSWFITAYYVSTDAGSLTVGFAALCLSRRVLSVHGSRVLMLAACAAVMTLSVAAALLPRGPLLLALLLAIGFACLGAFPLYYSFSQELTSRHQGKLTGALGCVCWVSMALLQEAVGDVVERTGSYTPSVAVAGLAPLLGLGALLLFWGKSPAEAPVLPPDEAAPVPVPVPVSEAVRPAPSPSVRAT
jgi:MFS transporter, ACS family, hexuronate transporter